MSTAETETTIRPGQEVRLFALFAADENEPPAGWPGRVDHVRDDEFDVMVPRLGPGRVTFAKADNRSTENGGKWALRMPAQAEKFGRRKYAIQALTENGITIQPGSGLSVDQVEALAAVARAFTDPEATA